MNNWTSIETPKELRLEAERVLSKLKKQREGKVYEKIKVSDTPLTYKEVEIKNK